MPLARHRAELLAHVPPTHSQDHRPALGHNMAAQAHRDGVAARLAEPAGPKRVAVALALIPADAALLGDGERPSVHTAPHPDAHPLDRLHTVPGLGQMLRRVRLYASQASNRFPRVQDLVSAGRLGPWAQASAGPRLGRRAHPAAQNDRPRLANKPANGPALPGLAQPLARAVSHRLQRQGAGARATCCQRAGRGAGEPGASRDHDGLPLHDALAPAASPASVHAKARRGRETLSPALCLDRRSRSGVLRRSSPTARVGGSSPEPRSHWSTSTR
jgi:hypothetical protein